MTETLFCYRHPERETGLRCVSCGNPICAKCAIHTPTGYRCPDCVRGFQKKFVTAKWHDYLLAALFASGLSFLTSLLIALVGTFGPLGWILVAVISPSAGALIAEIIRWATGKRRAPWLFRTAAGGVILGAAPMLVLNVVILNVLGLLGLALYLLLAVPTTYGRLSGLFFTR